MNHRKVWITFNGNIPRDANNRAYEIHHIDGNHLNNDIDNLKCVTIEEHYKQHYDNGDWGACVLIAKRMNLSSSHMSDIQRGKKRPGIGGVKKGTTPWNKNKSGYKINEQKRLNRIGKQSGSKLTLSQVIQIRKLYEEFEIIDGVGDIQGNGIALSYLQAFSKKYSIVFGVSAQCIKKVILKETWKDGIKIKNEY